MAALFALAAAAISALFALSLLRRWRKAHRFSELSWGIALAMFAAASVAVAGGAALDWDPTLYRFFWLFGAVLNVPWLALGSVALAGGRVVRALSLAAVLALHPVAVFFVFRDDVNAAALAASKAIPRGAEVWERGGMALSLGRNASILAWIVVVGIALWTSRPRRGMRPPKARVRANLLISIGVSIVAIGGFALGRIGEGEAFSVALALGVGMMYAGFRLAGRAPRFTVEEPGSSPT